MISKQLFIIAVLLIFISGSAIRVAPTIVYDKPLKYDSYYHVRVAELLKETGNIPEVFPYPKTGRPHLYPPLYHVLLGFISFAIGLSVIDSVRLLLPFMASIIPIGVLWFATKRYNYSTTALLAMFFVSFSPFFLTSSFDSPELISIFISIFAINYFLQEKYMQASMLYGVSFLFSALSSIYTAIPLVILLLSEKNFKKIAILLSIPAVTMAAWYLPRFELLYAFDNSFGTIFVEKTIDFWTKFYTPFIVGSVISAFALFNLQMDRTRKLWIIWTLFFITVFLTHFVTPAFHPWRMPIYLNLGFAFLLSDTLTHNRHRLKSLFAIFFVLSFFLISMNVYESRILKPPLPNNEYDMISWIDKSIPNDKNVLSGYVFCSNLMTFSDNNCLLDTYFESIPNKTAWFDYENFFWNSNIQFTQRVFDNYDIDYIAFSSQDWGQELVNDFDSEKLYATWECKLNCLRDASVYKLNKQNGTVKYLGG